MPSWAAQVSLLRPYAVGKYARQQRLHGGLTMVDVTNDHQIQVLLIFLGQGIILLILC
jgi:hypothetical protein